MSDWTPWPPDLARRYRDDGYWQGRPLGELVRDRARAHPERTAVVSGTRRWSHGELDVAADRLAAGLHGLGLRGGDRVVVHLPNCGEFVVLCVALFRLGAWPVLALPGHRRVEIDHLCALSGAVAYVVGAGEDADDLDVAELVTGLRARHPALRHVLTLDRTDTDAVPLADVDADPVEPAAPDPSEPALLLLSGGSTGLPKLIPRTHDDYAYNARRMAELCRIGADDAYLAVLPAGHNFPLACPGILGTLAAGGTAVLAPNASPPEVFPLIAAERVTVTSLVPALASVWMQARRWLADDLSSLRLVQVGGARLEDDAAARLPGVLGCDLQQVFGMAEGLLNATRLDDPDDVVGTTQGRPVSPADEVRVVAPDGRDVPPGDVGELLTRGPYTIRGYYRGGEHNERAFTPDGYYRSGDLVRRTPDGSLVVAGRATEQINRAGEKVSPAEVERLLRELPGVSDAVVVGLPDPVVGQRVCAVLHAPGSDPVSVSEVRRFLTGRGLAAYKQPERVEVVAAWPYTGVGKVDRRAVRDRLVSAPTPR